MTVRSTWPEVRIVIASAHALEWPVPGFVHTFVGKSFDLDRLVERIRQLLYGDGQ